MVPGERKTCNGLAAEDARIINHHHSEPKTNMKRTRRIEITRYRRTVTFRNQDDPITDAAEGITVIETAVSEWDVPSGGDLESDRLIKRLIPPEMKLTRTPFNFRRWLRQRF